MLVNIVDRVIVDSEKIETLFFSKAGSEYKLVIMMPETEIYSLETYSEEEAIDLFNEICLKLNVS